MTQPSTQRLIALALCSLAALLSASSSVLSQELFRPTLVRFDDDAKDKKSESPNGKDKEGDKAKESYEPPKTLLKWNLFAPKDDKDDKDNKEDDNSPYSKPLEAERPDRTQASTVVGLGVLQIEAGYNFIRASGTGQSSNNNNYPQTLIRYGCFRDWFEVQLGFSYNNGDVKGTGSRFDQSGFDDLYLACKFALTEQDHCLPEMAIFVQTTVPSGARPFTSNRICPGLNLCYGWELNNTFSLGCSSAANRAVDDSNHDFLEMFQSASLQTKFNDRWAMFTEFFLISPHGAIDPEALPQYYIDGGFTFRPNKNIQLDINAGLGLNKHADDWFVGAGCAVRF